MRHRSFFRRAVPRPRGQHLGASCARGARLGGQHVGQARRLLLYQYCAADAWPLTRQPEDWDAFKSRLLCGDPDLVAPRVTNVPVRLPLPPAKRQGSIYESQLELKNSYFGTAEAPRTAIR